MRFRAIPILAVALLLSMLPAALRADAKRVALVIGNAAYAAGPLKNPVNDASDLAQALRGIGFTVALGTDANKKAMYQLIEQFGMDIRGADIALFYYSGHGVQAGGENFLIPIGAEIGIASDVESEGVQLQRLIGRMDAGGANTNIVILDACRNNPFPEASRGMERGLAVVGVKPPESIIVYSTEAGETADDGGGRNGVFTASLLANIARSDDFASILLDVKAEVRKTTDNRQRPASYENLTHKIYLNGTPAAPAPALAVSSPNGSLSIRAAAPGFVLVNGATFMMGSPTQNGRENGEMPHRVTLSPFSIAVTDVTVAEFRAFVEATGYQAGQDGDGATWKAPGFSQTDRDPVVCVSWYDAVAYCNWKSQSEGRAPAYRYNKETDFRRWPQGWNARTNNGIVCDFSAGGYRLPTEAEWEYAAKGGGERLAEGPLYAGSPDVEAVAWYSGNADNSTHPVGQKKPNALGLYDMAGDAWQWVQDWYAFYGEEPQSNPRGPVSADFKVLRGGSFDFDAAYLQSDYRGDDDPWSRKNSYGFRLAYSSGG
jgi:formylglycine-generating enzyme required for sulfatase activity